MMSNNSHIKLTNVHKGELLTEVVRSYMHGAMPSALLHRLNMGLDEFLRESKDSLNDEDLNFTTSFRAELQEMYAKWCKKEDETYGGTVAFEQPTR